VCVWLCVCVWFVCMCDFVCVCVCVCAYVGFVHKTLSHNTHFGVLPPSKSKLSSSTLFPYTHTPMTPTALAISVTLCIQVLSNAKFIHTSI